MPSPIRYLIVLITAAACGSSGQSQPTTPEPAPQPVAEAPKPEPQPEPKPEPTPEPQPEPKPEPPKAEAPQTQPQTQPAPKLAGRNFLREAQMLHRVAACHGDSELPAKASKAFVDAHCAKMKKLFAKLDRKWMSKAKPFFKKHVPSGIPATVVYPFGGADLLSALAVFPNLTEITTLGLEYAGDPRAFERLDRKKLERGINATRKWFDQLVRNNHNRTIDMMKVMNRGGIPGQLIFSLTALSLHGYDLVSLRYFRIARDGTLTYLTDAEIAPMDAKMKRKPKRYWLKHRRLFANMEIRFRKAGDDTAPVKTYRTIQGDLEDKFLRKDDRVLKHLKSKGKITAMTKAASFLLWWSSFSKMRSYLLANMQWMVSDATGIPNRYARKAGFEQLTWGRFLGHLRTLDNPGPGLIKEMRKLWKRNKYRKLDFRFGYPDSRGNHHLMITRPVAKSG